jgi:hypothetical protein
MTGKHVKPASEGLVKAGQSVEKTGEKNVESD